MPLTFPAHVAAALPLRRAARSRAEATALVVGCMTPDLAYAFAVPVEWSHTVIGLVTVDIAVGLACYVWTTWLFLPWVNRNVSSITYIDFASLTDVPPPQTATAWARVTAALTLGAATHVLWDGLAHDGWWPARALYPGTITLLGHTTTIAALIWKISTVLGSLAVAAYCLIHWRSRKLLALSNEAVVCVVTVAATAVTVFAVVYRVVPHDPTVGHWHATIAAAQSAIAMLSTCCISSAWRSRRR